MVKYRQSYLENVSQMISWGHWFVLFNILLAMVFGTRYLLVADWPGTLFGRFYSYISLAGHFSFLVFVVYLLVLFPLTFIIPSQRWLRFIATIIATAGMTLLLLDSAIFTRFHLHLNPVIWQLILNPEPDDISRNWQSVFIAAPIILLIEMIFASWSWQKLRSLTRRRRYVRPFAILLFLSFVATHMIYIWADANFYRPITMQRANFPASYPMTARGLLARHGLLDAKAYQQRQSEQGNPDAVALQYPLSPLRYQNQGVGYNLLLITVEQLNATVIPAHMPALAQFASNNISFTRHFSSGNQPVYGLFSLFYGISPSYFDSVLITHTPAALLNALNHQNYQLGLFSSDGFNNPLYRQALITDFSLPTPHRQTDSATVSQWQNWLQYDTTPDNHWFSWIALNGSINTPDHPNDEQNGIQITDNQIQRILQTLSNSGQMNHTVVIITAATGTATSSQARDSLWSSSHLHVPLVIHWPNTPAQQISRLTNHTDIMVTLMRRLLHVSTPPADYSQGEDLFNATTKRNWVISATPHNLAIITSQMTLVLNNKDHYQIYSPDGEKMPDARLPVSLLLQVLTDERRFIAN